MKNILIPLSAVIILLAVTVFLIEPPQESEVQVADLNYSERTILIFSDFHCSYCAKAVDEIDKLRPTENVDFRHFPVQGDHAAAVASVCAGEQGRFWEYHDILFANTDALDTQSLAGYAQDVGLDVDEFIECANSQEALEKVRADSELAKQLGIQGTPTFVVYENGTIQKFPGVVPAEQLK